MTDKVKSYSADIVSLLVYGSDIPTPENKQFKKGEIEDRYFAFFNSPDFFYQLTASDGIPASTAEALYIDVIEQVQKDLERILR